MAITLNRNAKFSNMAPHQVASWVRWANSHDWGGQRDAYYDEATSEVVTFGWESDGTNGNVTEGHHKTPEDMRGWAGY